MNIYRIKENLTWVGIFDKAEFNNILQKSKWI